MPYSYPNDIPAGIKNLPDGAKKIWVEAFNAVLSDTGSENKARIAAWGRVKQEYKKEDGKWVKKELSKIKIGDKMSNIVNIINTTDKGFFKTFIPLNEEHGKTKIFEKKIGDKIVKFLRGQGTNTQTDKEEERISKAFVAKIKEKSVGLNVFAEHEHTIEKTLGYIDEAGGDDNSAVLDTALEDENDNPLVKKILQKIAHGTKIGYSIGGKITKARKVFDDVLKKMITEIEDGEIYEVSLTAMPAGQDTWVAPIAKSMRELCSEPDILKQLKTDSKMPVELTKEQLVIAWTGKDGKEALKKTLQSLLVTEKQMDYLVMKFVKNNKITEPENLIKTMDAFIVFNELDAQLEIIDEDNPNNLTSEDIVKKFTKALDEMVQANKIQNDMWDIFYSYRQAIYTIVESEDLTPADKKTKITALSSEFANKIEQFASEYSALMEAIDTQLEAPETETAGSTTTVS